MTNGSVIAMILASLVALVLGVTVGFAVSEGSWRRDCGAIGAHVMDGKVYDCKVHS